MIKFKRKNYTIPEGHYTGPKDMEEIPGYFEMISKGSTIGAVTGGVVGHFKEDSDILTGALTGSKYGAFGGLLTKLLLNYIHKPMTSLKYQDVDRVIRRKFGIFQVSGFTVGDDLPKRAKLEDKFSFNDRNVSDYKLNFAIHNDQLTMYTFGMTREELDSVSKVLDYYCKKYYSMEYSATVINQKVNSYSVKITFTNTEVIGNFIMELSQKLNTKINLLDNNAIVTDRLIDATEKTFSLNNYDLMKTLGSSLLVGLADIRSGLSSSISSIAASIIYDTLEKTISSSMLNQGRLKLGDLNSDSLKSTLKKLHYVEGYHYTIGFKKSDVNISLNSGVLAITAAKKASEVIDREVWNSLKTKISRKSFINGRVVVYLYTISSSSEFEMVLKKLMSCSKPNIFEKELIR